MLFKRFYDHFKTSKVSENNSMTLLMIYDNFGKNEKTKKFGGRFIDNGLENVTVAAARVVELPPRCSNKLVQKRRCL